MKFNYSVQHGSLTHDDLVCLLQYIHEGPFWVFVGEVSPSFIPEDPKGNCYEDEWAECLLNGGKLYVYCSNPEEDMEGDYSIHKAITLEDLEEGISILGEKCYSSFEDLVKNNCDFWTYYNWFQCALYKEIIYA